MNWGGGESLPAYPVCKTNATASVRNTRPTLHMNTAAVVPPPPVPHTCRALLATLRPQNMAR